jgi:LysM repeat protein
MPQRAITTLLATSAVAVAAAFYVGTSGAAHYTVRPGDSLWALAQRYHTSVAALASANHMLPGDLLITGRVIAIPTGQASNDMVAVPVVTPVAQAALGSNSMPYGHMDPSSFCADYRPAATPVGVLPAQLMASPSRLSYRPYFVEWGEHYGVSPALLEAIAWQESGWQEGVVSSTGAVGVGQIEPGTAQFVNTQLVGLPLRLDVVSDNIRMEASFVAYLSHQVDGTCETVAAYYEGARLLERSGVIPETQQYVADVEALIPRFQ